MFAATAHLGAVLLGFLASPDCPFDPLPPGAVQRLGSPRFRHGTEIRNSAMSPDGKRLATVAPNSVIVWDVATGKRLYTMPASGRGPSVVAFSPTGKRLVMSYSNLYQVWNMATGRLEWSTSTADAIAYLCQFGATDDILHGGVFPGLRRFPTPIDQSLRIETWRIPTGELLKFQKRKESLDLITPGIAFEYDFAKGQARVWEWATGREAFFKCPRPISTSDLAVSPDLQRLARVEKSRLIQIFERGSDAVLSLALPEELIVETPSPPPPSVQSTIPLIQWFGVLGFSEDGNELWLGQRKDRIYHLGPAVARRIYRWDARSGKPLPRLEGWRNGACRVHYPSGGKLILAASNEGAILRWDRATGRPIGPLPDHARTTAFSADASTFATLGNGKLSVINARTGQRKTWPVASESELALSRDGTIAASRDGEDALVLVRTATNERFQTLRASSSNGIQGIEFSPDGKRLAAMGRGAIVWNLETGTIAFESKKFMQPIFTSDGRLLTRAHPSTPMNPYLIQIWDGATPRNLQLELPSHLESAQDQIAWWIDHVVVSPDRRLIATPRGGGHILLHDFFTGKMTHCLPVFPLSTGTAAMMRDTSRPTAAAFSHDGNWLAIGTNQNWVEIWETASGTRLARFTGHDAAIEVVRFAADRRSFWSASGDGLAYRWEMFPPSKKRDWNEAWRTLSLHEASAAAPILRRILDEPAAAARFFRTMYAPLGENDRKRIDRLILDLGNDDFRTREKAEAELFRNGLKATTLLEAATRDANPERGSRALRVLNRLSPSLRVAELRARRVVGALERANPRETRQLLEEWSRNSPYLAIAGVAKAALARTPTP